MGLEICPSCQWHSRRAEYSVLLLGFAEILGFAEYSVLCGILGYVFLENPRAGIMCRFWPGPWSVRLNELIYFHQC